MRGLNNAISETIYPQSINSEAIYPQSINSSTNKIQGNNGTSTETRRSGNFANKLFLFLFFIYFWLIAVLVIFLTLHGLITAANTHHFHPKKWYPPILASAAYAGIVAFAWQAFTSLNLSRTIRAAFWLSPLLTCGYGILLVSIGSPGALAASVIALVSSIIQALYACWASPRFDYAYRIITASIAYHPPKVKASVFISIITCILYVSFLITGIGGATATRSEFNSLSIFLIIGSLAWTMQIVKNMMQVTVSHIKYMQFACGIEVDFKAVVQNTAKYSMGSICMGSILVPVISIIRGLARSVSVVSGDVDEFLFSCANCCSGVASNIVIYGNRWDFVHVVVYNKGIVQASKDTWETFRRMGMENLVNSDLTSSFCFLCGTAAGSMCALVGGSWTFAIYKTYATEVSIYGFLTGYFMSRMAMAWIQASVSAYYVGYAENPQSQQFDNTIPIIMRELQRSQVSQAEVFVLREQV